MLVIWNRYGANHEEALHFERLGGTVLVAENGYLGEGGRSPKFAVHPKGPTPGDYYALALGFHNGAGRWPVPDPIDGAGRFAKLAVALRPWRQEGEHILVCPNRAFGVGAQVMRPDWGEQCAARLRKQTKRPVRVRPHPGNNAPARPLEADLEGAWAVVVWSSSVALHALAAGIPTYIEAPHQIVKGASARGPVDSPQLPERLPHFERMAWAQWTCAELETGEPFIRLLRGKP